MSSYGYDAVSRLASLSLDVTGTAQDASWTFAYNPASQIGTLTRDNDSYAWNGHYNVDRNYASNGLNQYTTAGAAAFAYDANGNLTSDGSTTYLYDIENRLVSASGAKTAGLRYDPLGRLYETTGASGTTRLLQDGDELVAEFNGSGTLLRRYVHGSSVDDPVVWYEGSAIGPARWLHTDWQGSVIGVTDSSAASIAINRYDEYGIPGSANIGRFQYTGQAWIPELGMYYYKARIYSPTLGRFMQTDPIGYNDQINLYAYVGNDPVNKVDPMGLAEKCSTGSRVGGKGSGCKYAEEYGGAPDRSQKRENLLQPQGDDTPRGGDTQATRQAEIDDVRAVNGEINSGQLSERREARANGAATGAAVLEGVVALRAGATALSAGAKNALKAAVPPPNSAFWRSKVGRYLENGQYWRLGWSRNGGMHSFRMTGEWIGKIPESVKSYLGTVTTSKGTYWNFFEGGPL